MSNLSPIISPELASELLVEVRKVIDNQIIHEICVSALEVTPQEIRQKFENEQRRLNPTVRITIKDK